MKISGAIIQNRNIKEHSKTTFHATYKGKNIWVSSNHGLGKPKEGWLTRYNIEVTDIELGMFDVNSYEDCHTMEDAIRYALKGACLIPS